MSSIVPVEDLPGSPPVPQSAPSTNAVPMDDLPQGSTSPEAEANAIKAHDEDLQAKAGGTSNQLLTGIERGGSAITFGGTDYLAQKMRQGAQALGVPQDKLDSIAPNAQRMNEREEANPGSALIGTIGGLTTGIGEAKVLQSAGKAVAERAVPEVVGEGTLAGIKRSAVKLAAENALYQAGDENSKMIRNDPNQSVGSAITNIGLAAALGGLTGGALSGGGALWRATVGEKAGQLAADFKSRYNEHLTNPDPVGALTDELSQYHQSIKSAADEVYGASGLKAQDIAAALPEHTPKVTEQLSQLQTKVSEAIQKLGDDPLTGKLHKDFNDWLNATTPQGYATDKLGGVAPQNRSMAEIFKATEDFKQQLQEWGKYNKTFVPLTEKPFRDIAKQLGFDFRQALEQPDVWGKAAERQLAINKAFTDYLPTLKDFEKRFTTEVNGVRTVDPGKVNTYMNQLGKPSAEIKQDMLRNFLDASEHYRQVISDTHANLGVESPMEPASAHFARKSLDELTPGAKLADLVVKKGYGVIGKSAGAGIGGLAGALVGHPYWGAVAGEHILGPFIESTLPALAKPLLDKSPSATGLKAATEYSAQVVRGQKLATDAVKSVFDKSIKALPDTKRPTPETRAKLKSALEDLQKDPNKLIAGDSQLNHYMTDHAVAMSTTLTRVLSALQAARPSEAPKTPLDIPRPPSKAVQAQYDRILDIAQQPLVTIEAIKNGRLTSKDVMALNTMYPELYQGLKQKLMTELVNHKAGDNTVPYSTRMGLSLFLGQPLDSTMTPGAIQAAQPKPEQPQGGGQVAETGGKKPSNQAGSTMLKNSKLAQTPTQQSEAMHSTGKA